MQTKSGRIITVVSIGVIEISNIVKGYVACDNILKATKIEMVMAQPICPGKFVMVFGGTIASIDTACSYVNENFSEYVLDIQKFGNIDKRVFDGLNGACSGEATGALGLVETFTAASCILAADAMLKAANVELSEIRIARGMGGKSYVAVCGSVGAVNAAVEAGAINSEESGTLVDKAVIASPHEDLWQYIQ